MQNAPVFRPALQMVSSSAASTPSNAAQQKQPAAQASLDRWVDISWGWLPQVARPEGRERLVASVYGALCRVGVSVVGCSAEQLADVMAEKEARPMAVWVRCCLDALEGRGFAYRTYDRDHYLPTNPAIELSDVAGIAALARLEDNRQGSGGARQHREGIEPQVGGAARPASLLRRMRPVPSRNCLVGLRGFECSGVLRRPLDSWVWDQALTSARKARLHGGQQAAEVCNTEHSSSGEYVLCGRSDGRVLVYKAASADARLRDTWAEALQLGDAAPVRDVKRVREINQARWNPTNRNEVGTSSRRSPPPSY